MEERGGEAGAGDTIPLDANRFVYTAGEPVST
jgi:hypothetical protein